MKASVLSKILLQQSQCPGEVQVGIRTKGYMPSDLSSERRASLPGVALKMPVSQWTTDPFIHSTDEAPDQRGKAMAFTTGALKPRATPVAKSENFKKIMFLVVIILQ